MSLELWFDSDSEEECPEYFSVTRRRIRDSSNPLDLLNDTFVRYFRVSKSLFVNLLELLENKMGKCVGSASILPIIKLAAALRFFAEGTYQKGVGNDMFVGMAQPTFSKTLTEVIMLLESHLCPTAITFPTDDDEKDAIKRGFYDKTGFPGIIGCVDGTHVKIISPAKDQHLYYNRKGFHSMNVMLVCDHNLKIRFVNANHPGSCHDSFVFNGSGLSQHLATSINNGERNTWLLGDSGYPLKPYLITPFRTNSQNSRQAKFNEIHTKARITVERTIGVLKNTFRCTIGARLLHYKPEKASKIINVCCALHNMRIEHKMDMEEYDLEIEDDNFLPEFFNDEDTRNGSRIRDEIMNSIV